MTDRLTSTLIEASNIYQLQLADAMLPNMLSTFQKLQGDSKRVRDFQMRLREVVLWNKDTIDAHTNQILLTEPLLDRLIAAVYLATVQVLSHVRLPRSDTNIKVQVPGTGTFVHTAYKLAAQKFYERIADGHGMGRTGSQKDVIAEAIHSTINKLLPLKQLLEAYIAKEIDDEGMVSPEPFAGAAHAFPVPHQDAPSRIPDLDDHERSEPDFERPPEANLEQQPEADLGQQPETELDRQPGGDEEFRPEHSEGDQPCWLDDGKSDKSEPGEEKNIILSPRRRSREVMCEDAGDSGELD